MLNARQRQALAALLANPSRKAAARASGISESALFKYEHNNAEFAAALAAGRDAQMTEAVQSLTACTGAAIETLRRIVDSQQAQDMTRIAAARALLEFALRFSENTSGTAVNTVVFMDDVPKTPSPVLLGEDVEINQISKNNEVNR